MSRTAVLCALVGALGCTAAADARDAARPPLAGTTVVLDPGHNGGNARHPALIGRLVDAGTLRKPCDTVGTATARGYRETDFTWDVARRLRALLRRRGARVVLTRPSNTGVGPCITERAAIGNRARADAAVSIHADGGPPAGRGFHVIHPRALRGLTDDIAVRSRRLALRIRAAYRARTGIPYATYIGSRGLDLRSDLGGLNLSDVPKVFLEAGNMQNRRDAALLENAGSRARMARALADGLQAFLRPASR